MKEFIEALKKNEKIFTEETILDEKSGYITFVNKEKDDEIVK